MERPHKSAGRSAVLALDDELVEWLDPRDPERPRFGHASVEGTRPADWADAAERALARAGSTGDAPGCVLALGEGLVKQRLLQLPPMARGERLEVLTRKARRLCPTASGEVVFSARLVDPEGQAAQASEERRPTWLLTAADRRQVESILSELRGRGLRIGRVLAQRSASLCRAWKLASAHESSGAAEPDDVPAWMVVSVDRRATCLALVSGERLVTRFQLNGDFLETPSLGSSLLQDLRNCAGYWRKVSRGGGIRGVAVIGLDETRGASLADSIRTVLGEVPVLAGPAHPDHPDAGAVERLLSCLDQGPFQAELAVRVPPSRRLTSAVLGSVAAGVLALSAVSKLDTDSRVTELLEARGDLAARVTALESGDRELRDVQDRAHALLGQLDRAAETARLGIPFGLLADTLLEAFRGRAKLVSAGVRGRDDGERRLVASGRVDPDPLRLVRSLKELAVHLEECGILDGVELRPATEVPGPAGAGDGEPASVAFTIEASVPGTRP